MPPAHLGGDGLDRGLVGAVVVDDDEMTEAVCEVAADESLTTARSVSSRRLTVPGNAAYAVYPNQMGGAT